MKTLKLKVYKACTFKTAKKKYVTRVKLVYYSSRIFDFKHVCITKQWRTEEFAYMKAWWIVSLITEIIFYYSIQDKMGIETVKQLLCSAELGYI